jgi:hypothetical protein
VDLALYLYMCMWDRKTVMSQVSGEYVDNIDQGRKVVQEDSKLLLGFPFIVHGNPDNNLESHCIILTKTYLELLYVLSTKLTPFNTDKNSLK